MICLLESNVVNETTYSASRDNSLVSRVAKGVREKIYAAMVKNISLDEMESILDVGVTSDRNRIESNFFERMYSHKERITALSDQDASWMEEQWPGLRFVRGDGRFMPFASRQFDLVFSSAVIEHVGARENQIAFIKECVRVARSHVFITTPNRWHPVEFHTVLPFLHWLPKNLHRRLLRTLGYGALAREDNLNLLDRRNLADICSEAGVNEYSIGYVRFCGAVSNLLLHIKIA